jgi:hypothetical protein
MNGNATGDDKKPVDPGKRQAEVFDFVFRLKTNHGDIMGVDSALIVLDKYDLTGAGVVMKVVTVDSSNHLKLQEVPPGKYFAVIYTYGLCKQNIPVVITVRKIRKKRKANSIDVRLAPTDIYVAGKAEIPPEDLKRFSFVRF